MKRQPVPTEATEVVAAPAELKLTFRDYIRKWQVTCVFQQAATIGNSVEGEAEENIPLSYWGKERAIGICNLLIRLLRGKSPFFCASDRLVRSTATFNAGLENFPVIFPELHPAEIFTSQVRSQGVEAQLKRLREKSLRELIDSPLYGERLETWIYEAHRAFQNSLSVEPFIRTLWVVASPRLINALCLDLIDVEDATTRDLVLDTKLEDSEAIVLSPEGQLHFVTTKDLKPEMLELAASDPLVLA